MALVHYIKRLSAKTSLLVFIVETKTPKKGVILIAIEK